MHRLGRLIAAALVTGALPTTAHAAAFDPAPAVASLHPAPAPQVVPGEIVVGFTDGSAASTRARARDAVDGSLQRRLGDPDVQLLDVTRGTDVQAAAARLEARPGVAFAEPNYVGHVAAGPDDPQLASPGQPALTRIAAQDAWQYTTGSAATRIAILDTGVDLTHPDLAATGADDAQGHGTAVAGVAAAQGDNGVGITGVAWRSDLRGFAACNASGQCPTADQAAAINAASAGGVQVATMAIDTPAGSVPSQAVQDAIAGSGMLIVAAAGNGTAAAGAGRDLDAPGQASYPCSYPLANVVCVAATRATSDSSYTYTNYGATSVDVAAPGQGVLTTTRGGDYGNDTGTSIAVAQVAGVAALMWSLDSTITPAEVKDHLMDGADALPGGAAANTVARGRLNALAAVAAVGPPATATITRAFEGTATFRADRPGTTFACAVDAGAFARCTSPWSYGALPPGAHTVKVRVTDASGRLGTAASAAVNVAPTVRITSPAASDGDALVADFASDVAGATFECRVDAEPFASCSDPQALEDLAGGDHVLSARAVDGVRTGSARSVPLSIDRQAPVAAFEPAPDTAVTTRTTTFAFTADEPATFTCAFDGRAAVPCSSPIKRTLADTAVGGDPYELVVTPTDAAGNTGTPISTSWTVASAEPAAPPLTLTGDRTGIVALNDAHFAAVTDPTATLTCTMDTGDPAACGPSVVRTGLSDGAHTLRVTAQSADGSTTMASQVWTVDTTPPSIEVTGGPPALGRGDATAVTWTVIGGAPGATTCALDDAVPAPCTDTFTVPSGLTDGVHHLTINAVDAVGNHRTVERRWTVDRTPPDLSPVTRSGTGDEAVFTFGSTDRTAAFECRLDGDAWETCRSGQRADRLTEARHTVDVRAQDPAGNPAGPVSLDFDVAWPSGPSIVHGPAAQHGASSATVAFGGATAYQCRLDGVAFGSCGDTRTFTGLADGLHSIDVRALEPSLSKPTRTSFVVDTQAPSLTITDAPRGTVSSGDATVRFSAEPGATTSCRLDDGAATPCDAQAAFRDLSDGDHAFVVRAIDAAGNASTATAGWSVRRPVAAAAPTVVPTPTATATTAPVKLASTLPLSRSVLRRFAKSTGASAARAKPVLLAYRATLGGTLEVRVELAVGKRWTLVGAGTKTYARGGSQKVKVSLSKTGRTLLRKRAGKPKLRVRAVFTPR